MEAAWAVSVNLTGVVALGLLVVLIVAVGYGAGNKKWGPAKWVGIATGVFWFLFIALLAVDDALELGVVEESEVAAVATATPRPRPTPVPQPVAVEEYPEGSKEMCQVISVAIAQAAKNGTSNEQMMRGLMDYFDMNANETLALLEACAELLKQ